MERTGTDERMRRTRLNLRVERFQAAEHPAEAQDRVLSFGGSTAVRRPPFQHADDIRAPWHDRLDRHVEPRSPHFVGDCRRDLLLAGRAGDERRIHGVDGDELAKEADGWIRIHLDTEVREDTEILATET